MYYIGSDSVRGKNDGVGIPAKGGGGQRDDPRDTASCRQILTVRGEMVGRQIIICIGRLWFRDSEMEVCSLVVFDQFVGGFWVVVVVEGGWMLLDLRPCAKIPALVRFGTSPQYTLSQSFIHLDIL